MDDIIEKEGALVYSLSILQATFIFKPWRRQETTSAKNARTLLQKEFFQNETKTVMMLEFIRRELVT